MHLNPLSCEQDEKVSEAVVLNPITSALEQAKDGKGEFKGQFNFLKKLKIALPFYDCSHYTSIALIYFVVSLRFFSLALFFLFIVYNCIC